MLSGFPRYFGSLLQSLTRKTSRQKNEFNQQLNPKKKMYFPTKEYIYSIQIRKIMLTQQQLACIKVLVSLTILASIFHLLIFIKVIPYAITWGGRLQSDQEMYVFETISIIINAFYIFILLQKRNFTKPYFTQKTISIALWVFFVIFSLNTAGNIVAKTDFEKYFALLTFLNAILLWKINKSNKN